MTFQKTVHNYVANSVAKKTAFKTASQRKLLKGERHRGKGKLKIRGALQK